MKNEKGITLASLTLTIIILIILSAVAINSGVGTIRYTKFNKAKSEIEIMQTNVNSWYQEYMNVKYEEGATEEETQANKLAKQQEVIDKYGVDTSDSSCDQTALTKTVNATGITSTDYKFLSASYIKNNLGLDASFDYLINIPSRSVILFNGYLYNGKTYYTAEHFDILNVVSQEMDGITFSLAQGDNNDVIISDLKLVDTNSGSEADISKFIVQYKKDSDTNWSDATASVVKYIEGNKTKFKFTVPEVGDYDVKISTTDKKNSNEKTVMIFEKQLTEEAPGIYISTIDYTDNTESDDTKILNVDGAMLLSAGSQEAPSRIENDKFVWRSSNTNVATVTTDGVVKCGTETGIATITLYGSNNTTSKCRVKTTAKIAKSKQDSNYTINGAEGSDVNPTIPAGFYAIDTNITETVANNIDWKLTGNQTNTGKGLAIMNEAGDQFVWVPVKKDQVVLDTTNYTTPSTTAVTVTSDLYTPMATTYTYNGNTYYRGMLYEFAGNAPETTTVKYNSGWAPGSTQQREPSLVTGNSSDKWAPMTSVTGTKHDAKRYMDAGFTESQGVTGFGIQMQTDYDEMITQIQAYGGFWIGRFESSFNDKMEKIASVAGAKSYTAASNEAASWYGLYKVHKEYSNYSSMIWGSQYDAMMNWMAKNGVTVGTSTVMSGTARNIGNDELNGKRITGNPKYNDKLSNVIDIYGNSYEWSLEACYIDGRAVRGGSYDYNMEPSWDSNYTSGIGYIANCSRISLYIK